MLALTEQCISFPCRKKTLFGNLFPQSVRKVCKKDYATRSRLGAFSIFNYFKKFSFSWREKTFINFVSEQSLKTVSDDVVKTLGNDTYLTCMHASFNHYIPSFII